MGFLKSLFGPKVDYHQMIKDGAVLLDVRSPGEFKSGHNRGALNVPLNTLSKKMNAIQQKNKPVVVICESGMRAAQAKRMLKKVGVEAYNGGSWRRFN